MSKLKFQKNIMKIILPEAEQNNEQRKLNIKSVNKHICKTPSAFQYYDQGNFFPVE